jgi:thiol-disulfide isomerase/thioredoxin
MISKQMNKSKLTWLVLILAAAVSLACETTPPPRPVGGAIGGAGGRVRQGLAVVAGNEPAMQAVSRVDISTPDGGAFKLTDWRGKVMVIDFWGTFCPPCVRQAPRLAELYTRYREQGLEIVGLSLDKKEDNEEVKDFIKRVGINYTVGYADQRISAAFLSGTEDDSGAPPIPQLFVFARDGRLVEHLVGEDPERGLTHLEKVINQQLALSPAAR